MSARFWALSLGLHGAVLWGAGLVIQPQAEFGLEIGKSSLEVNLVAAAPEPTPAVENISEPVLPPPEPPKPDDLPIPEPEPPQSLPPPVHVPAPLPPQPKISQEKGDGSAPQPGRDAITAQSAGGAETAAKPDYLRNPPPSYPESARRAGAEGVVLLRVQVNAQGRAEDVTLKGSSGHGTLDEAAIKAVRKWKFKPARLGSIPIGSKVDVPIRFQLD